MTATMLGRSSGDLVRTTLRDHLGSESPRLVVLAMSKDENPKATILAFSPSQAGPRLVVKAALTQGAVAAVRAEGAALRAVAALDPGLVDGTVPRFVDEREDAGGAVLVMEALPGTPLSVDYHRWRHTARPDTVGEDFACAAAWLRELDRLPVAPHTGTGTDAPALASRLRGRWPEDPGVDDVAQAITDLESALRLPRGARRSVVHGDFWSGNVLRTDGRVTGVVDWEHAVVGGDPIRDRVRFVLSYALYLDRHTRPGRTVQGHPGLTAGAWGEPIRYAVRDVGWLPSLVAGFLSEALVETGREPTRWRDALTIGVAEIAALSDHADFARQHLLLAAELLR